MALAWNYHLPLKLCLRGGRQTPVFSRWCFVFLLSVFSTWCFVLLLCVFNVVFWFALLVCVFVSLFYDHATNTFYTIFDRYKDRWKYLTPTATSLITWALRVTSLSRLLQILCNFPKAQHPTMPPYTYSTICVCAVLAPLRRVNTYSTARRCSSGKCVMKE